MNPEDSQQEPAPQKTAQEALSSTSSNAGQTGTRSRARYKKRFRRSGQIRRPRSIPTSVDCKQRSSLIEKALEFMRRIDPVIREQLERWVAENKTKQVSP